MYDDLLERYDHQIKLEKQQGTYDLETEFLPLDAETKKRFLFQKGQGGATPFGKDTVRDITIVNNLKRPFTKQDIDKRITDALEGQKPVQVRMKMVDAINEKYPLLIEERKAKKLEVINRLKEDRDDLPQRGSGDTEKENERIQSDWTKLEEIIHAKTSQLATYVAGLENTKRSIIRYITMWNIGDVVRVPFIGTTINPSWGIFLGVSIGKSGKNPYTLSNISLKFGVTDSRKILTYSLQPAEQSFISQIFTESRDISEADVQMVNLEWNELIKKASSKRERRHILTENIVGASNQIGTQNKLIKYNTKEGTIKNGILLHRDFGKDGEANSAVLPISEALNIILKLEIDDFFADHKLNFRVKRISENYFQLYLDKKDLYSAIIDEKLRSFLKRAEGQSNDELPDFVQNAGDMTAALHIEKLQLFLNRLDAFGVQFLGHARELEDWEIENEADWKSKTKSTTGSYKYRLGRAYGQGSNPTTGFVSYESRTRNMNMV